MASLDMQSFIEEKLLALDSTIQVGVGSEARALVTTPIIERFGIDLLDVDPETFLVRLFADELGDTVDTGEGKAIRDLFINVARKMVDAFRRVVSGVRGNLSLEDPTLLSEDEMDSLVANFFHARVEGARAVGTARALFRAPQSVLVNELNVFESSGGLRFVPVGTQTISATEMALNRTGSLYYFDVSVEAEEAGEDYEIGVNGIASISGLPGAVGATNLAAFSGGVDRETNSELMVSLESAITTRTLSTRSGIKITLPANLSAQIRGVQVVGARDLEMERDIVRVNGHVTVSDVPGGIQTPGGLVLAPTDLIHIGGHTDIYITQKDDLEAKSQSIVEVASTGRTLRTSQSGYTAPGTVTDRFFDARGLFQSAGALEDGTCYLRLSAVTNGTYSALNDSSEGGVEVLQIVEVVSETEIRVQSRYPDPTTPAGTRPITTPLAAGLGAVSYEIVQVFAHDDGPNIGLLELEVTAQVALDSTTGEAMLDQDGAPVSPIPGDPDLAPILDGLNPIPKTVNQVDANVSLPAIRVTSMEVLDPLDKEPTGVQIPYRHPVDARVIRRITAAGLGDGALAEGIIRLYFLDPTQVQLLPDTRYPQWTTSYFYEPGVDPTVGPTYAALPALRVSGPWVGGVADNQLTDPGIDFELEGIVVGDAVLLEPLHVTSASAVVIEGGLDPGRSNLIEDSSGDLETENIRAGDTIIISNIPQGGSLETRIESVLVDDLAGTVSITVPNNPFVLTTNTPLDFYIVPQPLTITGVSSAALTLDNDLPGSPRTYWIAQGARAASMADSYDGAFYFVDVAVRARQADALEVETDSEMVAVGYRSQGFELVSPNTVLTFSTRDRPYLRMTEYVGDSVRMSGGGAAARLNYEYAASLPAIQEFIEDDDERPAAEDILAFHAVTTFIRMSLVFSGGATTAAVMQAAVEDFIRTMDRESNLTTYDLQRQVFEENGALAVTNPIELVGLTLGRDRTYTIVRSEDALISTPGAHFLPDPGKIVVTKTA